MRNIVVQAGVPCTTVRTCVLSHRQPGGSGMALWTLGHVPTHGLLQSCNYAPCFAQLGCRSLFYAGTFSPYAGEWKSGCGPPMAMGPDGSLGQD